MIGWGIVFLNDPIFAQQMVSIAVVMIGLNFNLNYHEIVC